MIPCFLRLRNVFKQAFCRLVEFATHIHLEVLLPAFVLGAALYNPHNPQREDAHRHEHTHLEPEGGWALALDEWVKAVFMLLVGASLPRMDWASLNPTVLAGHVLAATLLSNLGKRFPAFATGMRLHSAYRACRWL